jgi:transposase
MNAPETALAGKDTGVVGQLYMALELSDKKWLLVLSDQARGPSRYTVNAGDKRAVLDAIAKAKARLRPGG